MAPPAENLLTQEGVHAGDTCMLQYVAATARNAVLSTGSKDMHDATHVEIVETVS